MTISMAGVWQAPTKHRGRGKMRTALSGSSVSSRAACQCSPQSGELPDVSRSMRTVAISGHPDAMQTYASVLGDGEGWEMVFMTARSRWLPFHLSRNPGVVGDSLC